ncbi:MAG: M48 family metallopeptidase [Planctomycetales bacterium]|nr:M48 family metallopeptidase [Planctomycetales bacterium]
MVEHNGYFYFAISAVVGLYLLDLVANWLNVSALQPEPPGEFKEVFSADKYAESQQYLKTNTRFDYVSDFVSLAIFLAFWLMGGFGMLDEFIRGFGYGEIVNGLLFMFVLFVAQLLISIPFELYHTFVIEEKFGFNKTTIGTWASDQVKGLVLAVVIGAPILALMLWLFGEFGKQAWLYAWISMTAVTLLLTYLGPSLIMPLFNKFEPLEEGELKTEIDGLAAKCDFPLTEVSVMDGSKRSAKTNAFFTGFGKNKKIALFDTLIEKHSVPELVAVLAHEIGHYKKKHIIQGMVIGILKLGVISFLIYLFMNNQGLVEAFGVKQASVYCSFVFFFILFKPISFVLSIGMSMLSRKNEFEADAYAAEVTGGSEDMISALKQLPKDNLSNLTPHPFYAFLFYSHPPIIERLAALRRLGS